MSLASIQVALDTKLQTLAGFDPAQCAWIGVPFTPKVGTPYIAPKVSAISRTRIGSGQFGTVYIKGNYQISLFYPINNGTAALRAQQDAVIALFSQGTTLTTSDGWLVRCDAPTPMPDYQDGEWVQAPIIVPWFVHYDP